MELTKSTLFEGGDEATENPRTEDYIKMKKPNGKGEINYGYLVFLIFSVALGNIQFGYAMGGWNVATAAYGEAHSWGDPSSLPYARL